MLAPRCCAVTRLGLSVGGTRWSRSLHWALPLLHLHGANFGTWFFQNRRLCFLLCCFHRFLGLVGLLLHGGLLLAVPSSKFSGGEEEAPCDIAIRHRSQGANCAAWSANPAEIA